MTQLLKQEDLINIYFSFLPQQLFYSIDHCLVDIDNSDPDTQKQILISHSSFLH